MYIYMYVCMYMYMLTYTYIHTYTHAGTFTVLELIFSVQHTPICVYYAGQVIRSGHQMPRLHCIHGW